MMEAVPRLPMLSFPGKLATKPVEFGECLKRYIQLHYHEDPESYNNEITELESLRRSAVNASTDFIGCSALKKYYCQLHYLISRFPPDELGSKLQFHWTSAFDQSVSDSGDINYEMNSILYNIATHHTILGAADARISQDGMKISCTHFQCASWAFQVLSQNSTGEGDFNPLLITFMTHLTLSQAQECILEKSMTDNRKPNIIAKVAMQVVEYLRLTLKNLESFRKSNTSAVSLVGSKLMKVWQRHCDFKIAYYVAVTYFHQGLQSEEQQKMGERIAFYQAAVDKLDEALKLSKNMEKAKVIGETLTFANDVIRGKLTAAQKENEFVYHEKVPQTSSLPEVKGASLVKGISFSFTDKEVAGPDIFSRLVPIEAHQASSLYSEEKAKLLRRIAGEIQEKNEELEMYLASMQLDSFAFEENYDNIPQELVDACADLNSRDAFKNLQEIINTINTYYRDLQIKIKETEELIKEEESNEKEFCIVTATKRAPNQILTEQKREITKYKEAHEAALASNQALQHAIDQHKENLMLLSKPLNVLLEFLPSVAAVESEADKATRMEVQRLLGKVHEMQAQRSEFEGKLRSDLHNDDITKQLVLNHEDTEAFFKEELSKHNQMVSLLEQNMAAQSNILQALSESNAAYGAMRRTINQVKNQRLGNVSSLLASYNAFLNILLKAEEAKEFYTKLESQVNKVISRVKSFCEVQEEERKAKMAANVKKFGGNVKLDYNLDSKSVGPKLKDFLQAGVGIKGFQSESSALDASTAYQTDLRGSGGYPLSTQTLGSEKQVQPLRPNPINTERGIPVGTYGVSQTTSSVTPQLPPSAPSPAPSYSNQSYYYPTNYYQQNQVSDVTTTTTTNTSTSIHYANLSHPTSLSNVPYNYTQPLPFVGTSHSSYNNAYQQPGNDSMIPQTTAANSTQYVHSKPLPSQPLGHQGNTISLTNSSKINSIPNSQFSQQYPSHSLGMNSTATYSSSGNYVSQAGARHTTISSSIQNQNVSSTSVPNLYYNSTSQYVHSNYPGSSSLPSNFTKNFNSDMKFPTSVYNQSNVSINSQAAYSQGTIGQSRVIPNSSSQHWSAADSNPYKSNYNAPVFSYSIQTTVPSTDGHYAQKNIPHTKTTAYQVPVSHSSVPYTNVFSTAVSSYSNYSQPYGYSAAPTTAQPTCTNQYYSQQHPSVQTTAPHTYPHQQLAQNTTIQSRQEPDKSATVVATNSQEGISNLDLLSGLDMNMTSSSQWFPLIPQTTTSSASTSEPETPSSVANEVSKGKNLDEIEDSTIAAATLPSSSITSVISSSNVIDLAKLAKPTRSTSVLDPLSNDETLSLLATETERFSKFVQGLDKKSLNGPTNLEMKWTELTEAIDSKCSNLKVSVGRCYPLKNRFPDNLSFDETRVPLPSTRDDYINASYAQLKSLEESIPFIVTQAPMPNTYVDFWSMVWENQVEIIVCINTDAEVKNHIYFAKDASENVDLGAFTVALKQCRSGTNDAWIQRTLQISHNTLKSSKVVLHMQFLTWPPGAMPESPSLFLQFLGEVHNLQKQQRNKLNPAVVHCISGTGRSGLFIVLSSFIKQLQISGTLADIWSLVIELSQQRRSAIQDRSHLMFLYTSALYYAQYVLMKRGILTDKATFEEGPREKTHVRHPSSDLLSTDLNRMKVKLGLDEGPSNDSSTNLSRSGSQSSVTSADCSTSGGASFAQPSSSRPSSVNPSPTHSVKGAKIGATELPPNLAASLDPNCLILSTPNPNKAKKITKENFLNNQTSLGNLGQIDQQTDDPFSGLDPMWNLKKA